MRGFWKSDVPEGVSGEWAVERFVVRDHSISDDRLEVLPGGLAYSWPPGLYTRLRRGQTVFMTDTQDEWMSHCEPISQAARRGGRVLVNGLGLGLVVEGILRDPSSRVEHLTVVELSNDVIRLVGRHLTARYGDRLEIVTADAFAWQAPADARFSVVWHDLWDRPDSTVFPEIRRLEKRYRGLCDWQGSWPREYARGFEITASAPPAGPFHQLHHHAGRSSTESG